MFFFESTPTTELYTRSRHDAHPISREEVKSIADLHAKFPNFQDEWLRDKQPEVWVPKEFKGQPFNIFETGGTTGMPKQRIGWNDYKVDYEEFSDTLNDEHFPRNHYWLMVGPTGPRRLRLAIEHLANVRGCSDRKSTRLNSSHVVISYAVFCLKKKKSKKARA